MEKKDEQSKFKKLINDAIGCGMDAKFLAEHITKLSTKEITEDDVLKWASGELFPSKKVFEEAERYVNFQLGN